MTLLVLISAAGNAQDVPALTRSGNEALQSAQYFRAIELFRTALEKNPSDFAANIGLSEAYYWLDEPDQAWVYVTEAKRLAGTDTNVGNLQGRIAIALGRLDLAEELFLDVAAVEPNNVDAQIGLAELALAKGQSSDAAMSLESALTLNPQHRKTLLSLVLVYEQLGRVDAAERYLELAQSVHRDSPEVHILAAEYHLRRGDLNAAALAARTAQAIMPLNRVAAQLRAEVAFLQGDYIEALATVDGLLSADRNDTVAWYIRAQTLLATGASEDALTALRTILRIDPDDEIVRIVAESVALANLPLDSPVRSDLAHYAWDLAQAYRSAYQYGKALAAYQRALRLSPFRTELRRDYAELHRTMGNLATYLEEIRIVQGEGTSDGELDRRVEVYASALRSRTAGRWKIEQFSTQRSRIRVGLYTTDDITDTGRVGADHAFIAFAGSALQSKERMEVADRGVLADFAAAFRQARSEDVDYFILLRLNTGERSVRLGADLYLGRTGTKVGSLEVSRTGQYRVNEGVVTLVDTIAALFPLRTRVMVVSGRRVVVDAGSRDGLGVGDELRVIPPEVVSFDPESVGFSYSSDSILGTLRLTSVDDLVSAGEFSPAGLSSEIKIGDTAFVPGDLSVARPVEGLYPILYERVRQIR